MTNAIVSVIIANYNRAELLENAIESVLAQTFQDFELIIWDDGSLDNSREIIEKFQRELPAKIKSYVHDSNANRGIVTTYLMAISKSRGKYIAFLEHDDLWSPSYLENKVGILEKHPEVGVVFSPYRVMSKGWFGKDMMLRQWLLRLTIESGRPFDNFPNLLQSNNIATFSCFMTRKSLLDDLSLPDSSILAFDWWVLTQLSTRSLFYHDPDSHTYWRWSRESTIGKQKFEEHRSSGCDYMELMYKHMRASLELLPPEKGETFEHYRKRFDYFVEFYRRPSLASLGRFFIRSPIWALAATASLVINFLKFR